MSHTLNYLQETRMIADELDHKQVERMVQELCALRERKGRLWIAGLGGSAANASHAANDFRKLCNIEAYCLTDNVAELTARINDEGFHAAFSERFWEEKDALFILSVGGGTVAISAPLVRIGKYAKGRNITLLGIVGRADGYTATYGDCVIIVPTVEPSRVTPHTEGWQSVILHCIVSHPDLQVNKTKW